MEVTCSSLPSTLSLAQKVVVVLRWWAGGISKRVVRDSLDGVNLHKLPLTLLF